MATAQQYRRAYQMLMGKYRAAAKKEQEKTGSMPKLPRVTQSTLILFQQIDPTKTSYTFPVLDSDPLVDATEEIRLNINDEFFIIEKGLYIVAKVFVGTPPDESRLWFTHAPLEFAVTAGWLSLQNLYRGGVFSITVNNVTYVENWDTKKHEYWGVTQMQNRSAGLPFATAGSADFSKSGMFDVEPNVTLSGAKKNEIFLELKAPIIFPAATTWLVGDAAGDGDLSIAPFFIAVVYRGLLAQNAAKFQ